MGPDPATGALAPRGALEDKGRGEAMKYARAAVTVKKYMEAIAEMRNELCVAPYSECKNRKVWNGVDAKIQSIVVAALKKAENELAYALAKLVEAGKSAIADAIVPEMFNEIMKEAEGERE